MIQSSIIFKAKNEQEIEIRTPYENEAQLVLDMMVDVAAHSPYILSTPENFKQRTVENQIKWFKESSESDNSILLAAFSKGRMIGFCDGRSYKDLKRKHRAGLGISLHPDFRGLGVGQKMMEVLLSNMKRFAGIFPKAFILPSGEVSDNLTMYLEV